MEIILKSKGVHLYLDNTTAEQLLNLSAVARFELSIIEKNQIETKATVTENSAGWA